MYLIYNPNKIEDKYWLDKNYKESISDKHKETIDEINNMGDMCWLFKAVYEFQKEKLSKHHLPDPSFEFVLTDQDGYKKAIEKV